MNILIGIFLLPFVVVALAMVPRRLRMARRAQALLAEMPQHELKTVYLAFKSGWYLGKRKEMEAKIAEEREAGWTYLKATEANPFKTIRSWGGGLNLQFIRKC